MKFVTLSDHQIQSLTHTLQDIVEVYEEGDDFDQEVAVDLRDILGQLELLQAE